MPLAVPTYDLADFPPEIRERVRSMTAIAEDARHRFPPRTNGEESEEERQRWAAMEFRIASRREQGRLP